MRDQKKKIARRFLRRNAWTIAAYKAGISRPKPSFLKRWAKMERILSKEG